MYYLLLVLWREATIVALEQTIYTVLVYSVQYSASTYCNEFLQNSTTRRTQDLVEGKDPGQSHVSVSRGTHRTRTLVGKTFYTNSIGPK